MSHVSIKKKETLSDRKYKLELYDIQQLKNGHTAVQQREVYCRPPAVAILLYDPARKTVLLTRQFRLPVLLTTRKEDHILEACAGIIDNGELPEHAVVREVEEETGYRISEFKPVAQGFPSPSSFTEYIYLYTGIYSPEMKVSEGGGKKEEGEDIEIVELTAEQARRMLKNGEIRDIKTILLLQNAALEGLI